MPLFFIWVQLVLPSDQVVPRSWVDDGRTVAYILLMELKGKQGAVGYQLWIPAVGSAAHTTVFNIYFLLEHTLFTYLGWIFVRRGEVPLMFSITSAICIMFGLSFYLNEIRQRR